MRILVVYDAAPGKPVRRNSMESVFCYRKYCAKQDFVYEYNYHQSVEKDSKMKLALLKRIPFDAVIFHFTFLAYRWHSDEEWQRVITDFSCAWPKAVKAVAPQDEHCYTARIIEFMNRVSVDLIFTCASGCNKQILYPPNQVKAKKIYTILAGYVEDDTIRLVQKLYRHDIGERRFDIGYRARSVPDYLGKHGWLKTQIVSEMKMRSQMHGLRENIRNTTDTQNVFWGGAWFEFMLECDTMPGCLAGSSIMDADNSLRIKVEEHRRKHRNATFEEVSALYLKDYEGNIDYTGISPRIFESIITKTCQILIEADYKFLKPEVHYISLKKDFSNVDEVLEKVKDKEYCRQLAENAYRDVILSRKYSYQRYVKNVIHVLNQFIARKRFYGEDKCAE